MGGRLKRYTARWLRLNPPLEVAAVVTGGLRIAWKCQPPLLNNHAHSYHMDPQQEEGLAQILQEYQELGAITQIPPDFPGYSFPVFGRQKASGKWRLISDLHCLNESVHCPTFKMEGLKQAQQTLTQGAWMFKMDVKHAYLHVPVAPAHQRYLTFTFRGQRFKWAALPFGLSTAPRVFTKVMRVVVRLARAQGITVIAYLDDLIIIAQTKEQCWLHAMTVARLLYWLGFEVEWTKTSQAPAQTVEYLGVEINTANMTMRCTDKAMQRACQQARDTLRDKHLTARELGRTIGRLVSLRQGLPPAFLYTRELNVNKTQAVRRGGWDGPAPLQAAAKAELRWWVTSAKQYNGTDLKPPPPQWCLTTDASEHAWGATLTRHPDLARVRPSVSTAIPTPTLEARETWEEEIARQFQDREISVNVLELEAVLRAVRVFKTELRGKCVVLRCDNSSTVWDVLKWKSRSLPMNARLRELFLSTRLSGITLLPQHIAGVENTQADKLSRYLEASDWQLHPLIFKRVQKMRRRCKVDGFASARNHLLDRWWSWKREPGAEATDFFQQTFIEQETALWLNPPFELMGRVLAHVERIRARATLVVPAWPWAHWWPTLMRLMTAPPLTLPRWKDTFRPVSRRNQEGVGLPPWACYACEVSGDRHDQLSQQRVWGEKLHRPDGELVRVCGQAPRTSGRGVEAPEGRHLLKPMPPKSRESPW